MRKGYLFVEVMVFLAVLVMVAASLNRFFRTFTYELPKGSRLIQESCTLNNAVEHIRADVASAKSLSESVGDSTQLALLIIETADGMVSYSFNDGQIIRSRAGTGEESWLVPHCRIDWRILQRDKTGYAVEVNACLEDRDFGRIHKKMANSFLFFAGTPWEAAE